MPTYAVGLSIDIIHLPQKLPLAFPPDALHEAVEPYARGATLTPLNIYLSTNYNIYTEIYTTNTQKSKQIIPKTSSSQRQGGCPFLRTASHALSLWLLTI